MGIEAVHGESIQTETSEDFQSGNLNRVDLGFNVSYNGFNNYTEKTYSKDGVEISEIYSGNVKDKLLCGDNSLTPYIIKKGDVTFTFEKDEHGNELTNVHNLPENGIHSKTYYGHIENLKDCDESKLFKIHYERDSITDTYFRGDDGLIYIQSSKGYTEVTKDGKTYLYAGTVTDIKDKDNKLIQIIFKDGDKVVSYDYSCKDIENLTIKKLYEPNGRFHFLCYRGDLQPDDKLPTDDKLVREVKGDLNYKGTLVIDYKYDEKGRCISKLISPYNTLYCANEECYEYDENGGKVETHYTLGMGGKRSLDSTKIYNGEGILLKEYSPDTYNPAYASKKEGQVDVDNNGGQDIVTSYFDANGQLVREDIVLQNSAGLSHGTMQRFYADGKLVFQKVDGNQSFDGDIDDAISRQGGQNDCWFLTDINNLQMKDPEAFKKCIKLNSDGTVNVTLYLRDGSDDKRKVYTVDNISLKQIKDAQERGILAKEGSDWDLLALEYALLQYNKEIYGEEIIPAGYSDRAQLTGVNNQDEKILCANEPFDIRILPDGTYFNMGHCYTLILNENGGIRYINPYNNGIIIEPLRFNAPVYLIHRGYNIISDMLKE